eukprot:GHRR01037523.1.p1 GENE.GHRR01037523.1~~GHRR01037523.1.p1  ORF type:complete len:111 (-),score=15.29 GHRR01037523.1:42-374(-)
MHGCGRVTSVGNQFSCVLNYCCRCVLNSHKAALYALRNFWKVLLQSSVRFNDIVTAFRKIESCRVRADNAYKTMLERYPTNVKVHFIVGCFCDSPEVAVAKQVAGVFKDT